MTITARPRQQLKSKFYVYYNDWTGEIISIGRSEQINSPAPYIITDDDNARKIVQGFANDNDFVVSSDRHREQKLLHKNEFLQLRKQEDSLFLLPEKRLHDWDIRVILYEENNQLVVEANRDMIYRLVSHTNRRVLLDSRVYFDFFLIRRDDPDYMIKAVSVDAETLVNQGKVNLDISDVIPYVNVSDISILTRRHFENYYFEILSDRFVDAIDQEAENRLRQTWQHVGVGNDAHIVFTQLNDRVEISSLVSAEQLTDAGMHYRRMPFYVVGNTPDEYLATFEVDIAKLRMGQKETFAVDFDIMSTNIMFHNPALKANKRKKQ
jgi:hypothetical protein